MKYLPLILAGLLRKPLRSALTLLSVLIAFLLFGLLEGINAGFASVIEDQHLDRLLTDPRVPGGAPMPIAAAERIKQVPGVTRVCARASFFGAYQDPKNGVYALATNAADWLAVRPEFAMPPEQLAVFQKTRAAIAMTPAMQKRLGLKLGDKVPVRSPIARKDGNPVWTFELLATFDYTEDPNRGEMALIHYEYFDEARLADTGTVDRLIVRIADPTRSAQTAAAIDQLFANSAHETRTQNEKEQTEAAIRQVGEISYFTNAIVLAVFFALLFVTGNTMAQSARERIPEFAVLRTLGFSAWQVLVLVLAESLFLCWLAAALGLALAAALFPNLADFVGLTRLSWSVVGTGLLVATLVALVSGLIPAWKAQRLRIVDALHVT
ncbi:ABC transporter permease [Steroidobacter sp.]|uniref:ABC transporter permease n=1 Tax=Steroidobacter sp. TaxID=1978227 RepID=UPI001A5BDDC7|nr:ABC transporter permease [Steroidobacter sp.]MBL8267234.1 ABC transporter permease [Steroidobacter sp.]